jgi:hypothetical protein
MLGNEWTGNHRDPPERSGSYNRIVGPPITDEIQRTSRTGTGDPIAVATVGSGAARLWLSLPRRRRPRASHRTASVAARVANAMMVNVGF